MESIYFDGQQSGERVLYTISPHPYASYLAIAKIILLSIFFFAMVILISSVTPLSGGLFVGVGIFLSLLVLSGGIWWNMVSFSRDRTYITDRRIIRFDQVSPFFRTKRELFWGEALKAKAYAPNLLYRMLRIGNLEISPLMGESENVRVSDVYYFEDLANYIDKILFTFKNTPSDMATLKPFVPKPRGRRD